MIVERKAPCIDCGCAFNPIDWNPPRITNSNGKRYYDSRCSHCVRKWQREYKQRQRQPETVARTKPCLDCNRPFDPAAWYHPHMDYSRGKRFYDSYCRDCKNARNRALAAAKPKRKSQLKRKMLEAQRLARLARAR